jgi:iron complex outermembrane recepter protein
MLTRGKVLMLAILSIALSTLLYLSTVRADGLRQPMPPQALADALEYFAKSQGYQLVYRADLVVGVQSKGAEVGLSTKETLQQLLRGTGLTYELVNEKTITIFKAADITGHSSSSTMLAPTSDQYQPTIVTNELTGPGDMKVKHRGILGRVAGFFAVCSYLTFTGNACAQATTEFGAQASPSVLEEIVVTARKREERSQDVPVAVTAIGADAIARSGATNLTDLNGAAPSVSLQNFAIFPFNLTAVIRGVGTADFEPSSDPAVAVLIDGVYQPASNGAAVALFDTESVEMLRGPQGTLFGRNTTAGAILISTKRPKDTFGVDAQATVGNYGKRDFAAAVTGPLLDHVLDARLAGSTENLDGYFHNYDGRTLGKLDRYSVRPSLLFTPSENITVFLTGEYAKDKSQTIPGADANTKRNGDNVDSSAYNTTINESLAYDSVGKSVTLNADFTTTPGIVTIIAGYRTFEYTGNFDVDATALTTLAVDRTESHTQKSLEARFASKLGGAFDFVSGLSYGEHDYELNYVGRNATFFIGPPFNLSPVGTGLPALTVKNAQQVKSFSAYFQGTYKFTEQLSADIGGNYSREKKTFDFKDATVFFVPATPLMQEKSWSNVGPKLGLNYKVTQDALLYASYSKGFRSGGFNGRAFDPRNLGPYDPEKVDAYEVGLKSEWLDHVLRLNLSTFYNKYSDLQRPFPNFSGYNGTTPNPLELVTFNAAGADIKGAEAEVTFVPVQGLTLSGALSYLDAKYNGFKDPASGASLDNLKLAFAPKWTGRVAALYQHQLTASWNGEISADYNYASKQETDTQNSSFAQRGATKLLNASLSVGRDDEHLKLTLWAKNLTDEVYVVSGQPGVPFFNIFSVNAPRTFGLTASTHF